ncbi:MAG: hypothetical protein NTU95_10285, partial [Methanothrix sp.]|nr:hypothetical protein [Methanothrix sp.]
NLEERKRPWIRFERKHSLSMVHLDWHTSIHDGKKVFVCVVLDDSSRRILSGGEFDAETTDKTQFYANKRDKNSDADSRFEDFLEENKIKHINFDNFMS